MERNGMEVTSMKMGRHRALLGNFIASYTVICAILH